MRHMFILLINGEKYFFNCEDIGYQKKIEMENIANLAFESHPKLRKLNEDELCSWFITEINQKLGVKLDKIGIDFIIRLKNDE